MLDSINMLITAPFRLLSAEAVTVVIVVAIAWIFWKALQGAKSGQHTVFVQHAPTLMTSLGIFGTFVGIVIGLLDFDSQHIEQSIGPLLEGLKTAFITSVAGMGASVAFKVMDTWRFSQERQDTEIKEDVTPSDIYRVLNEQKDLQEAVRKSIAGSEESSLVGQIRLLRSDFTDFSRKSDASRLEFEARLFKELKDFAEMMAKSATEQVIEALKAVIQDFNKNLTEQFGDNFKQLNEAVHKLVEWQENYMVQLEEMSRQYSLGVESISNVEASVVEISTRTATIPQAMEQLAQIMRVNQQQIEELQRHLDAFVQLREKAVIALPEIRQKVEEIGSHLAEGAKAMRSSLEAASGSLQEASRSLEGGSMDVMQTLGNTAQAMEAETKRVVEQILAGVRQSVDLSLSGVRKQVEDAVKSAGDSVNAEVKLLDQALQQELNTAMRNLGNALGTIVDHMARTYEQRTGQSLRG